MSNLSFTQNYHIVTKVLAHSLIEVKSGSLLATCRVVFVSYLFVDHSVTTVFLCICRNLPCVLLLNLWEIQNCWLLFFSLNISPNFSFLKILTAITIVENARCKVLCVQNPNLFLIYDYKYYRFRKEKYCVDTECFTYIKTI